jgi:hypothetical protein
LPPTVFKASVIYNTLAGLFHRRPDLLSNLPLGLDVTLAILHGLPLAIVAYSVAQLLLHDAPASRRVTEVGAMATTAGLPEMADERPAADTALLDTKNALQPLVTGYIEDQAQAAAQGIATVLAGHGVMEKHRDTLLEHARIIDHATSHPIIAGSTPLNHHCPCCTSLISQAQYAAAVRRGAAWRGCAQCRSTSP